MDAEWVTVGSLAIGMTFMAWVIALVLVNMVVTLLANVDDFGLNVSGKCSLRVRPGAMTSASVAVVVVSPSGCSSPSSGLG